MCEVIKVNIAPLALIQDDGFFTQMGFKRAVIAFTVRRYDAAQRRFEQFVST